MRKGRVAALFLAASLIACGGEGESVGGMESPAPPDASQPQPPDGSPPAKEEPLRFVAMGDTGEGNDDQYAVAAAIEDKCDADGCDFVVLLGDNIYNDGVSGVDDPQWQTKFEDPYANLELPFFAVLGNHDYNANGLSSEWSQGPVEVAYTDHSDKWEMPATHYTLRFGSVGFIMLDTNSIFWDDTENGDQESWYPTALAEMEGATWVFAAGHHPYLSNAKHGNAGNYDSQVVSGIEIDNPIAPANGVHVKEFFDTYVCGTVDLYFSGHDHNRQWLDDPSALCGTELIVSGAGAKLTEHVLDRNPVFFEEYDTEGFVYIVVDGDTMTAQFVDKHGVVNYERSITK